MSPRVFSVDGPHGALFGQVWEGDPEALPILLMHDSLGAVTLWRDFPEQLAKATGRTIIAYDRAGFGQSCVRNEPIAPNFIAAEAREGIVPVLDALGFERVVLFGHSVGGGMSLAAAALLGDRIAGVVTVAAQAFVEDKTLEGVRQAEVAFAAEGQVERLARYHGERARWVLDAWIETWLAPSYATWSLKGALPLIQSPVLAMHGQNDEYGSLAHPEMVVALSGGPSRMRVFEGVGHMPHREVTEELLAETVAFLETLN